MASLSILMLCAVCANLSAATGAKSSPPSGSRAGGGKGVASVEDLPVSVFPQLGHTAAVRGIATSPDGAYVATASSDNSVILWDLGSGKEIRRKVYKSEQASIAFSDDGRVMAVADGTIVEFQDARTGSTLYEYAGDPSKYRSDRAVRRVLPPLQGKRVYTRDGRSFSPPLRRREQGDEDDTRRQNRRLAPLVRIALLDLER